jgi:hypothetical protein
LYLELTLGQMSPAETTVFNIPAIGDDLGERNGFGDPKYTMAKINRAVDTCSNPPQFRGVKNPITGLLDPDHKSKREDHGKKDHGEKKDKLQSRQNTVRDPRPAHEKQSGFPSGLKRPDLTFDGRRAQHLQRCPTPAVRRHQGESLHSMPQRGPSSRQVHFASWQVGGKF